MTRGPQALSLGQVLTRWWVRIPSEKAKQQNTEAGPTVYWKMGDQRAERRGKQSHPAPCREGKLFSQQGLEAEIGEGCSIPGSRTGGQRSGGGPQPGGAFSEHKGRATDALLFSAGGGAGAGRAGRRGSLALSWTT